MEQIYEYCKVTCLQPPSGYLIHLLCRAIDHVVRRRGAEYLVTLASLGIWVVQEDRQGS